MNKLILSIAVVASGVASAKGFQKPGDMALALFNAYVPKIEKTNPGQIVDGVQAVSGDIDGDGLDDAIVSFVLLEKAGGNAVVGGGKAIYLQKHGGMKVVGQFPEEPCGMRVDKIIDGKIKVQGFECMAPYMKLEWEQDWVFKNGKVRPAGDRRPAK